MFTTWPTSIVSLGANSLIHRSLNVDSDLCEKEVKKRKTIGLFYYVDISDPPSTKSREVLCPFTCPVPCPRGGRIKTKGDESKEKETCRSEGGVSETGERRRGASYYPRNLSRGHKIPTDAENCMPRRWQEKYKMKRAAEGREGKRRYVWSV